jgi:hypothetical protein
MGSPIELPPPPLPPPPPLHPKGIGDLLEAAFDLYRARWVTLIEIAAVVAVPLTVLQYFVNGEVAKANETIQKGAAHVPPGAERVFAGAGIVAIVTVLVWLILAGAIAWAAAETLVGREPTFRECYRVGYARMWSILLVGVLSALAVLGGFILLIVPGFIVLTHLICGVSTVVVEGKRGWAALSRSWKLVRHNAWRTFGAIVITGFVASAVTGLFGAIFRNGWFLRGLAAGVGSAIVTPFGTLVLVLIYFDLRVRKENLDLATLERELQAASP